MMFTIELDAAEEQNGGWEWNLPVSNQITESSFYSRDEEPVVLQLLLDMLPGADGS